MAKYEPTGATEYSADEVRAGNGNAGAESIAYPDPFPAYPGLPYRAEGYSGKRSAPPAPAQDPTQPPRAASPDTGSTDYHDPVTDPSFPVLPGPNAYSAPEQDHYPDPPEPYTDYSPDGFDPFGPLDPRAFEPEVPWYRTSRAVAALGAIGIAVIALLIAAVLLMAGGWGEDRPDSTNPASTTTAPSSSATTTTPRSSALPPPPPPPPPPESTPPSAGTRTYWPQYPRQSDGDRPNVTTPRTRPPDISVRPSHRPAFPNQPGTQ